MATKVQLLRERLAALRENGAGAGWDNFAREDLNDAEKALNEARECFKLARTGRTANTRAIYLLNGKLAIDRAENLIEIWEGED